MMVFNITPPDAKDPDGIFWKSVAKMLQEILHDEFHGGDMKECNEKPCELWWEYFEKRSPDISGKEVDV